MMEVTQADAYREACTALGEAIVAQRLMQQHAATLEADNTALRAQLEAAKAVEPSPNGQVEHPDMGEASTALR